MARRDGGGWDPGGEGGGLRLDVRPFSWQSTGVLHSDGEPNRSAAAAAALAAATAIPMENAAIAPWL